MTTTRLSLRAIAAGARSIRKPPRVIPHKLREAIALRVSAVNECPVCSSVHERIAARLGISPDEIASVQGGDAGDLDPRADIALRYAELRTLDRADPEIVREFEQAFNPEEQREVRYVVDRFTFNNAFNNTWEAWLPGAVRRRARFRR